MQCPISDFAEMNFDEKGLIVLFKFILHEYHTSSVLHATVTFDFDL